ncbi:hypothetical protein P692DRAFT_20819363 [Suillus brevipes Sb2]|nr:hypothetical protein P692DRAFT_20819363 [Suillus brevipes Sb2]
MKLAPLCLWGLACPQVPGPGLGVLVLNGQERHVTAYCVYPEIGDDHELRRTGLPTQPSASYGSKCPRQQRPKYLFTPQKMRRVYVACQQALTRRSPSPWQALTKFLAE